MKGYLNFKDLKLSRDRSRNLLQILIERTERQYLRHCLKIFNVPNRTRIYKDFGGPLRDFYWLHNDDEAKNLAERAAVEQRKVNHLEAILNCTIVQQWLAAYSQWYSVGRLTGFIDAAGIDVANVPVYLADQNQQPYYVQDS